MLNTSLNIHGKPNVRQPVDIAEELLADSSVELDAIYIDGVLLTKSSGAD